MERLYNWWFISIAMFIGYFIIAGGLFYLFNAVKRKNFAHLKIQKKYTSRKIITSEIKYSVITLLIYVGSSYGVYSLKENGFTKIYFDIDKYSGGYFLLSVLLMIIIHDTYFYWSHRLIHHPKLFRIIHRIHHKSFNPTPWASFSFHPFEAMISIGYIPIIIFLIPSHPIALFLFLSLMLSINILGHLGYELFSRRFMNGPVGKWINASTFHNIHHKDVNYNYGLYFTFWDRAMGTFKKEGAS